jgi:histidyl-tRNA synthetase
MSEPRVVRPRGVEDVLPDEAAAWQRLEAVARELFRRFGFREIRTPIFEHTDLFLRGVGEDTDIVSKEMYTFVDRAGRSLTLRPEATAGVVRAFLEGGLQAAPQPVKLFYAAAPMFRYDRPAVGRYRQFHQTGVEVLGAAAPAADAEVVALAHAFLREAGVPNPLVRLNSIGCPVCRPRYRERLLAYYAPHADELCPDCRVRLARNPLRLLDCKVPEDARLAAGAPRAVDALCADCAAHFAGVQELLRAASVPFALDPGIVRGLDYYTRTVFEVVGEETGALLGGGRYDGLVETLGGPPTPAVGFALGMERLLAVLRRAGSAPEGKGGPDAFVASAEAAYAVQAFRLAARLRAAGFAAESDLVGRGLRAQLRHADRLGARFALVLGEGEAQQGMVSVRDMRTGAQQAVPLAELEAWLAAARAQAPA